MKLWAWSVVLICCCERISGDTRQEYMQAAQEELKAALNLEMNTHTAKNVILFIGDGMGMSTVTAARIYKGQMFATKGKEKDDVKEKLHFEKFPYVGLQKTYNNDRQVTASASAATALMSGIKINYGTVGVDSSVQRKDCLTQQSGAVDVNSILKQSKDEGSFSGANLGVILGGGRRSFLLNNQTDPQTNSINSNQRSDGRDLIQEWKDNKKAIGKSYRYVWKKVDFDDVRASDTDYLLGLFSPSHMKYDIDRGVSSEPSISDMTKKAIQILSKNPKGFFLMVEGARIDHAHHDNYAKRALHDVIAMDDAVKVAMDVTKESETLIVVTADHSHAFSIAGYPSRGNNILGVVDIMPADEAPYDGGKYTTLVYGNGPANYSRQDFSKVDTTDVDYQQTVAVGMPWETHGGEDVAIYARGPLSHLFHGVHESNYVYHVMAYASCVGANKDHCNKPVYPPCPLNTASATTSTVVVFFISFFYTLLCSSQ
ncbi:alkaline phosphatase, tissue-nonspecific isozyme-like [Gigantopelta aegis]|uniref:alkaline phosphatase, tissue-nonspecific isozyme-like n=1 Tax=Gigantopelta aegis TaxID=1735272 RepID=UPI001B8877EA|nr:alkaline phosphatase, tissue-nonspecific isozyme-like [Gigantopelta aegis]